MPRKPAKVTQADVARVLRAVSQSDDHLEVVIETDGRIRILPHVGGAHKPESQDHLDWIENIRL